MFLFWLSGRKFSQNFLENISYKWSSLSSWRYTVTCFSTMTSVSIEFSVFRCFRTALYLLWAHLQGYICLTCFTLKKQSPRGVPRKNCSKYMQQNYRRTPMTKCDFNKVAKQLSWNRTSAWVFSYKFAAYFHNIFS